MLTLVKGNKKEKPDLNMKYLDCFIRNVEVIAENTDDRQTIKKVVFYGVKYINTSSRINEYELLMRRLDTICYIKYIAGALTPADLLQIFPVEKVYNGEKHQVKDYFSTMDKLRQHGLNKPMGKEVTSIFWDYRNDKIVKLEVECMVVMSEIRRAEGKPGLMEEFLAEQGIPMYSMGTDHKGRKYLINSETGEAQRIYKKKPRYLKLMKKRKSSPAKMFDFLP